MQVSKKLAGRSEAKEEEVYQEETPQISSTPLLQKIVTGSKISTASEIKQNNNYWGISIIKYQLIATNLNI